MCGIYANYSEKTLFVLEGSLESGAWWLQVKSSRDQRVTLRSCTDSSANTQLLCVVTQETDLPFAELKC